MAEFMINSDAFAWATERDPSLRSTIVTVILLDRSRTTPRGEPAHAAEIHRLTVAVRTERSLAHTQAIAGALSRLPAGTSRRSSATSPSRSPTSRGSRSRSTSAAWRCGRSHPFGPTIGARVNVMLMTYADTCATGIDLDLGAIPDPRGVPPVPGRGARRGARAEPIGAAVRLTGHPVARPRSHRER